MRSALLLASATTAAAAAAAATAPAAPGGRVVLPFGYAWRFHYGDDPTSPPGAGPGHASTTAFPEDLTGYPLCDGIEHAPNRFSLKDCRLACAYDPSCLVWQGFPLQYGRACYQGYAGMNVTCTPAAKGKKSNMGGGRRATPPAPPFRTDYSFAVADAASTVDDPDGGGGWAVVDAPHDFIAERGNFTNNVEDFKQGYLPRNASWYRKHFHLPATWAASDPGDGGATYVHFEGVFHHATVFLNGHFLMSHECGYTGFDVRIDNATAVRFGAGAAAENVLAVRADASFGSGHWYEGGGLYRPVHLTHVAPLHVVRDGLFVPPGGDGSSVAVSAELESTGGAEAAALVTFTLLDTDGATVLATATSAPIAVPGAVPGGTATATATLTPPTGSVARWSTVSPSLYTVTAAVARAAASTVTVDTATVANVGFRTTTFSAGQDGAAPFELNGAPLHFRGFSHHNSIGGLGVAIPERVELFRVQASRAMGSNIWRMSHNPYAPALYELLDATGQMCWDENRDYGAKYGGGAYAVAMRDMVKRDRNHPSVIMWSFCNEAECAQFDHDYSGLAFRAAAYGVDPTRPVAANGSPSQVPVAQVDVQGGSHWSSDKFVAAHKLNGTKPLVLSECCSCTSQRPDRDLPACIADQNAPGRLPYVTGSLGVWTLMDYFGEPHGTGTSGWPYVSCDFGQVRVQQMCAAACCCCLLACSLACSPASRPSCLIFTDTAPLPLLLPGQFDIAGFPKPHAYWYAANWAQGFNGSLLPGRPPLPAQTVTRFLDLPHAPSNASAASAAEHSSDGDSAGSTAAATAASGKQTLYSISTAPYSELLLDGVSQGVKPTPRNERGEIEATAWGFAAAAPAAEAAAACTGGGAASFPVNASAVQCHGLAHDDSAATADACAKACCTDASCDTWQMGKTKGSKAAGCWIGRASEGVGKCGAPKQPDADWRGGQRNVPGPTPTPSYQNATLVSRAGSGAHAAALGTHAVFAPSADSSSYRLQLTLDVPSAGTGTGGALLLDGRDTALIRAAFVDGARHDALAADATDRVLWRVISGPGRVAGVSNGDPTSHEWMKSDAVDAFLGLARGLVRVTQVCGWRGEGSGCCGGCCGGCCCGCCCCCCCCCCSSSCCCCCCCCCCTSCLTPSAPLPCCTAAQDCTTTGRELAATVVDADAARGPTVVMASGCDTGPIVVEASALGFAPVRIDVPVSVDAAKDGVMAVAKATATSASFSYLDGFVG
jgi:hypothetical protein